MSWAAVSQSRRGSISAQQSGEIKTAIVGMLGRVRCVAKRTHGVGCTIRRRGQERTARRAPPQSVGSGPCSFLLRLASVH
eukprot:scaffold93291_cov29-Tisochrysis_lutea.AAC.6